MGFPPIAAAAVSRRTAAEDSAEAGFPRITDRESSAYPANRANPPPDEMDERERERGRELSIDLRSRVSR